MDTSFQRGYEYFRKDADAYLEAVDSLDFAEDRLQYVDAVEKAITDFEKNLNVFQGMKTPAKILKGDVAEFFIADTYNVSAAFNRSENRVSVERSHDFASADIVGSAGEMIGKRYGSKFYDTAELSAKNQSISCFERYSMYKANGGKDSLEKYLTDRGFNDIDKVLNDPIYKGQIRIIPSDQLENATKWLKRMIATEQARRPEQVERYRDTLKMLESKIVDGQGNHSIELTKAEAEKLAILAKEGKVRAEDYGMVVPDVINMDLLIKESYKAGVSAAVISLVLKVGPEIYKTIDYLVKTGEIDEEQFKKIGFAAISGASEGFIRGSVASAIMYCCKSGKLGTAAKNVQPQVIAAVVVLAMNAIKGSFEVVTGKKTRIELANDIVKDTYISACTLICGGIGNAVIYAWSLGYLLGSFVGSVVGSFTYDVAYNKALSFCVDTGFTLFGLVEQDYTLPDEIIKEIGIETFDYETFEVESFEPESFEPESFEVESFEPDGLGITYLRRGVIGISKIGYELI